VNVAAEQAAHDALVDLVRRRIALSAERTLSLSPDACARCDRDLAAIERRIETAVCEIYGLSQADMSLIGGAAT